MRLLLIHSDFIEFEAKQKTSMAEEGQPLKGFVEEALVVFCAVESVDEDDIAGVVEQAGNEISRTADQLSVENIVLYPYAHLSSDLSRPDTAIGALKMLEHLLVALGFKVARAPFGWYKSFRLSCKGHPLSELSRTVQPLEEGMKKEKKDVTHEFFVLTPDGTRHDPEKFMDRSAFGCLVRKELGEPSEGGGEPAHVELMRSKELVDYEPVSDVGHLRWLPKGKLIRDLLADYVLSRVLPYGASPVETPVMYDLADKAIYEHADKFGERQYRFKSGTRNMMLRFAACFGMFSIMRDMHISPNTLPLKMYELSTYSFRHEQKGEVIGLKRLRAFTMPDMHTLCTDMPQALRCFEEQLMMGWETGKDFGTELVGVIRCTGDFYSQNSDWVARMVAVSGRPMLIELLSDRVHYWIAKVDLAAIDGQGRPIENPTVQIDVESSLRFDIKYHMDGKEVHPPILHCSPTGSVERVICAILESCSLQEVPCLPIWLSPTQVRVIPVAERHLEHATKVALDLNRECIRADLDDRDESVSKKVREAAVDWVPFVIVVGDSEVESDRLTVTIRSRSEPKRPCRETFTFPDLVSAVRAEAGERPFRPLYTPMQLSKRPRYI